MTLFCSFCNSFSENITHLFCDCTISQCLLKKLQLKLKHNITLLPLTPQAAIFGLLEADCQSYLLQSHILLILKLYIYKSRESKFFISTCLLTKISKVKNKEKNVASVNKKQETLHIKETGKKLQTNYIKEVITLLIKYK